MTKPSDRITVRLGVVLMDRLRAEARRRRTNTTELVRQAVEKELEPKGETTTHYFPVGDGAVDVGQTLLPHETVTPADDPLPRPIELALAASGSLDQANAWLEECAGSRSRLIELAGVELPVRTAA